MGSCRGQRKAKEQLYHSQPTIAQPWKLQGLWFGFALQQVLSRLRTIDIQKTVIPIRRTAAQACAVRRESC